MKRYIPFFGALYIFSALFTTHVCAQQPKEKRETIVFGLTPFLDVEDMKKGFGPIIEYVGESIGIETKLVFPPDYSSVGEDMRDGYIDIAWFAATAYVIAKERIKDLKIVACLTEDGRALYEGFIIARKDSGIRSLEDLKGKSFGFVDVGSSSGYVYPRAMFLEKGMDPVAYFKKMLFMGQHTSVIDAVYEGKIDAGATYNAAFFGAKESGVDLDQLIIIAKTDPIPQDVICTRPGFDEKIAEKIAQALFRINKEGDRRFSIKGYGKIGFGPGIDSDYDVVRKARAYR